MAQVSPASQVELRFSAADKPAVPARPASILILVRDGRDGLEVFLMQRTRAADFVPGANVFPGGAVDDIDGHESSIAYCEGLDDIVANRTLGLQQGALAYWIAAVRECFEESGLLLATDGQGQYLDLEEPANQARYNELRRRLNAGEITFGELCRQGGIRLAVDRMLYFSHWITPLGLNRRYDTRFFLAVAPPAQTALHDDNETVASVWIRPHEALERNKNGDFTLVYATKVTLEELASYKSVDELVKHAATNRKVQPILPRLATGRLGKMPLPPGHPAYAEVAKLDPEGRAEAAYEIVPGVPVRIAERVWRITAPNPGYMTGPGTNTYLLGDATGVTVIDPGPADETHVQALLEHSPGPITLILATHTHQDHSPAAELLKARTGARVAGLPAPPGIQDQTFKPEHLPAHGERIQTQAGILRVIHTPGHASNHLCFLLEDEKLLFTGDHIMQGSTVVISPPDGDMSVYLDSLRMLLAEDLDHLAPAHGFLMDQPKAAIHELIAHRLRREGLILRSLRSQGPQSAESLLGKVYSSLPAPLKPVAARSLQAHLQKLQAEGSASLEGDIWHAV